jgi:hypothetical protein
MLSTTESSHYAFGNALNDAHQASRGITQPAAEGVISFTPPVQTSALLALPTEILIYLLHYINELATPLSLSTTCHQLRDMYQDERTYREQDRQFHLFVYHLNTAVLHDALNSKLSNTQLSSIHIPDPDTLEWTKLRYHSLPMDLAEKTLQTVFIQKAYITAWDLLKTVEYKDKRYVLNLMQIVGKLSFYISNPEPYAKKLFSNTFPTALLKACMAINLEWGLHITCKHFPLRDIRLFAPQLDPT